MTEKKQKGFRESDGTFTPGDNEWVLETDGRTCCAS